MLWEAARKTNRKGFVSKFSRLMWAAALVFFFPWKRHICVRIVYVSLESLNNWAISPSCQTHISDSISSCTSAPLLRIQLCFTAVIVHHPNDLFVLVWHACTPPSTRAASAAVRRSSFSHQGCWEMSASPNNIILLLDCAKIFFWHCVFYRMQKD